MSLRSHEGYQKGVVVSRVEIGYQGIVVVMGMGVVVSLRSHRGYQKCVWVLLCLPRGVVLNPHLLDGLVMYESQPLGFRVVMVSLDHLSIFGF